MATQLYNPFQKFDFSPQTCFLTGQHLYSEVEQISVFPEWLLDRYSLRDKTFKMLDEQTVRYQDMKMPCSATVIENAICLLEDEIEKAFTAGYEEVINVPEERLFQWMAKFVYGVLYNDIIIEQRKPTIIGNEFKLSPFLQERFKKLHLILQSLVVPMDFKETKLWSIRVFKIKYSKDVFNYRNETTNLNFSLGMNDFGIVACLQDNGAVGINQQVMTDKFYNKILHPIQFEELCARFVYANYLLNHIAEYTIQSTEEKVIVESVPLIGTANKSLFDPQDDDMFAQVLVDYWKPWGITKDKIISFPNSPNSFLENDYTHAIIEPDSITLPY
ncbi:MAG: hypothetical protein SGJ15_01915 [Bacteroidota bacterium]|nr:hypothetical protein [Bacteroidota bacterium]